MRTIRDMYNHQDVVTGFLPAVRTADVNGAWVDLRDFDGNFITATIGAPGITLDVNNRIELLVQESDDASTPNTVADADLLGAVTGGVATGTFAIINANAKASQAYVAQYRGKKRYVRVVADFIGTHGTGTAIGSNVHRGHAHTKPVR